jgi:cysteine-rich repeat protein
MFPPNALQSFCGDGVLDPGEQCDDGNVGSGDGCSAACRLEGAAGINRYLCYGMTAEKNSVSRFEVARGVTLADRFETLTVNVKGPESLCNPADVGGSGIVEPGAHLRTYTVAPVVGSPRFGKRVGLGVVTGLGAVTLNLITRDDLIVPTVMSLTGPVGPPGPNAGDRYRCYGVKVTSGWDDRNIFVDDQFGQAKTYVVGRPRRLCVPVSKDGADIKNPAVDLLCHGVKPARGQPKHVPIPGINTRDEFWAERLRSVKEKELCVPAETASPP